MKILFKLIAVPFMLALTVTVPVLTFLFCYAVTFLEIVSGIGALIGADHAVHCGKIRRLCDSGALVPHFSSRHSRHSGMADRQAKRSELSASGLYYGLKIRFGGNFGPTWPEVVFYGKGGWRMATTRLIARHISKGETIAQSLADSFDYGQNPTKRGTAN